MNGINKIRLINSRIEIVIGNHRAMVYFIPFSFLRRALSRRWIFGYWKSKNIPLMSKLSKMEDYLHG